MESNSVVVIKALKQNCAYFPSRHLFRGKKMKPIKKEELGTWYSFVSVKDQIAVNRYNDWSDKKDRYLLMSPEVESLHIKASAGKRFKSPAIENFKRRRKC